MTEWNDGETVLRLDALTDTVNTAKVAIQAQHALLVAESRRVDALSHLQFAEERLDHAQNQLEGCISELENSVVALQGSIVQARAMLFSLSTPRRWMTESQQTHLSPASTPRSKGVEPREGTLIPIFPAPSQFPSRIQTTFLHPIAGNEDLASSWSIPGTPTRGFGSSGPDILADLNRIRTPPNSPVAAQAADTSLRFPPTVPPKAPNHSVEIMPKPGTTLRIKGTPEVVEILSTPSEFDPSELNYIDDGFLLPEVSPDQKPVRYIVYLGSHGNTYGFFDRWKTLIREDKSIIGAELLCNGTGFYIVKGFVDGVRAKRFYTECLHYRIFELLQQPEGDRVFYLVIQGVCPGIYYKRQALVHTGLGYRGGWVYRLIGTKNEANALFRRYQLAKKV
ncbi:hypothetical protein MPER_12161, partial [Moniliophthora perniciosa FA553]